MSKNELDQNRLFGMSKRTWEDDIKMHLKEVGYEDVD
jgi:hypothetical protein